MAGERVLIDTQIRAIEMSTGPLTSDFFGGSIGPFERGDTLDNEQARSGLGYTIAYSYPGRSKAMVYVYDRGVATVPTGLDSPILLQEFARATSEVLAFGQLTSTVTTMVDRYATAGAGADPQFLCAEFRISNDPPIRSYLYLTGAGDKFVKLRVTMADDDPSDPTPREFADVVASILRRHRQS